MFLVERYRTSARPDLETSTCKAHMDNFSMFRWLRQCVVKIAWSCSFIAARKCTYMHGIHVAIVHSGFCARTLILDHNEKREELQTSSSTQCRIYIFSHTQTYAPKYMEVRNRFIAYAHMCICVYRIIAIPHAVMMKILTRTCCGTDCCIRT
jgi:hypothetical protein